MVTYFCGIRAVWCHCFYVSSGSTVDPDVVKLSSLSRNSKNPPRRHSAVWEVKMLCINNYSSLGKTLCTKKSLSLDLCVNDVIYIYDI